MKIGRKVRLFYHCNKIALKEEVIRLIEKEQIKKECEPEFGDPTSPDSNLNQMERYRAIWEALSEEERNVVLLLPFILDSPVGSKVESWLMPFPEFSVDRVRPTLTKLQADGVVAFNNNWVWVIDSNFIKYLMAEVIGVTQPVGMNVEQIQVDNSGTGNFLMGEAVVFKLMDEKWVRQDVELYRNIKGQEPLKEFEYKKPKVSNQFFEEPTEFEPSARSGYYPLAIVRDVRRPPNHLYCDDDMLIAAKNFGS